MTIVGIFFKSSIGVAALFLAAGSQVILYTVAPGLFAITETHQSTLRGLVYFNLVVLIVMVLGFYFAVLSSCS